MDRRFELHEKLCELLGSRQVYFQPPSGLSIRYPCIVYELKDVKSRYAENQKYTNKKAYQITVIDPNPDSTIPDRILMLPLCLFDRHYTTDSLHHTVYKLFY